MILTPESRIKEYTAKGWWGNETIPDLLYARAKEKENDEALVDPYNKEALAGLAPGRMTYGEMIRAIDKLAARFLDLGLKRDDVVIVQLPNIIELTLTIFAAARAGLIVSPIPVQWRSHEISHAASLTNAKAFVTSHNALGFDHLKLAREILAGKMNIFITVGPDQAPGAVLMSDILGGPEVDPTVLEGKQSGPNDIFTLCWTSGTEASSKAVPRSHNHWLSISRTAVESFLPDGECVYLSLFPTINMAGLGAVLIPWVITGGKMVFHHPFDLGIFLKQLIAEKVYYTLAPPALLDSLAKSPQWAAMDRGALTVIGSGSAPLSPWMVKTFQEQFNIGIINFFASNEGVGLYSSPKDFPAPEDRAGFFPRFGVRGFNWKSESTKGVSSRLVDPDTEAEVSEPGVVGELRYDGPTVFPGYYNAPELTARAFDDQGFFKTGDLFSIAGDNNEKYLFQGRQKDLIIRGGVNISPEEIETLVIGHPKVAEVAAVGSPDERLGERTCVVVVPAPGETVTLEEINEFLKEKSIAKYKYPELIRVVEALPRNPVGKVLKRELRAMLKDGI